MFLWPLWRFWTYSPFGYLAAIIWNCCELMGVCCPFAHVMFGLIIGKKGKQIK